MHDVQVAIVGGGPAGLSTAGALQKAGVSAVVFDRDDRLGSSWTQRYDRLHLHTVRAFSGLAHFPIPRSYPKYLSRDMYAQYLELYHDALGIEVVHECAVDSVERRNGAFALTTSDGCVRARAIVIATGMFGTPLVPRFAGLDTYTGLTMHASGYKTGAAFRGKRVLVVGIGNTGAEIAADLVEQGTGYVAVSVRTGPAIVPRDLFGVPVQFFGIVLSGVPPHIADGIARELSRLLLGDLRKYGLPAAQWSPFSSRRIPVIDVGFVKHLKRGDIRIRPGIRQFLRAGAEFEDDAVEDFDAVIFATGYRPALQLLANLRGLTKENGLPHSGCGEPTDIPGLYFMGFIESHRGLLFEINWRSKRLARALARELH
jgi:thioredoxin reductase